jgi:hypothetical protein
LIDPWSHARVEPFLLIYWYPLVDMFMLEPPLNRRFRLKNNFSGLFVDYLCIRKKKFSCISHCNLGEENLFQVCFSRRCAEPLK